MFLLPVLAFHSLKRSILKIASCFLAADDFSKRDTLPVTFGQGVDSPALILPELESALAHSIIWNMSPDWDYPAAVQNQIRPEVSISASTSSALSVPREASSSSQTSDPSDSFHSSSTTNKPSPSKVAPTHTSCEQPHWTVYRYYVDPDSGTLNKDHDKDDDTDAPPEDSSRLCIDDRDQCLGKVIASWIDEVDVPCDQLRAVGKHERRFVHGGVKVSASIEWPAVKSLATTGLVPPSIATSVDGSDESDVDDRDRSPDARAVTVWEICLICAFATVMQALKAPPPPPEHEAQTTPTWKQPALPSAIFIVIPSARNPIKRNPG
ncbi:hypothetical protein GG344DRAFT_82326 [Lentinula edodes]|nr:hypothetical protein GG344DRAFT_82326 [Lentinula edodes]